MTDVIVIDKLTKSFKGKTVLEDVNMQLQEGGIYGIVGDNGSGKTVLLKLICGFMKPDSGTVFIHHLKKLFERGRTKYGIASESRTEPAIPRKSPAKNVPK